MNKTIWINQIKMKLFNKIMQMKMINSLKFLLKKWGNGVQI